MRLLITVGLTKKDFRDDPSAGESVNVTAELDSALLAKPDELQAKIHELFTQAETAISKAGEF